MFEMTQLTSLNISILLILLGAVILYFGRIIADTKVEKYDQLGYYIQGLFFSAVFILLPSILAYYAKELLRFPSWVLLLIQVIALSCISVNIKANLYLRKYGLLGEFEKIAERKITEFKLSNSFIGKLMKNREKWFKEKYGLNYVELITLVSYKIPIKLFGNKLILLLFSFLTILSSLYLFEFGEILTFGVSLVLTVFILTLVASSYGFSDSHYPLAKIHLDDGKTITGKILKFGDFIYVLNGDKKIFINKDKIKYIEESLLKEKNYDTSSISDNQKKVDLYEE